MHAVRVPLLGMMVAVGLLLVENVGAVAYREHAMASVAAEVAATQRNTALARDEDRARMRKIVEDAEAVLRDVEKLTRPADMDPVQHCEPSKQR